MSDLDVVTVWVPGIPKTKGSLDVVNRTTGAMAESVDNTGWRRQVAAAVRGAMAPTFPAVSLVSPELLPYRPIDVPVVVNVLFVLPAPKSRAHLDSATWPSAGDVDKLQRLVGDALNAGKDAHPKDAHLIADDNLIVAWNATKVSAAAIGYAPGALINVRHAPVSLINAMAVKTLRDSGVTAAMSGWGGF